MEKALSDALALEKKYDWLGASGLYEQALGTVDQNDFLKRGELQERIGRCLHRAAFQAESQEEFRQRLGLAVEAYGRAGGLYGKLGDRNNEARVLRCSGITNYLQFWLVSKPSEKRRLLDECLRFERSALAVFSELGEALEYTRAYNEFAWVFLHRYSIEWEASVRKRILEEGVAWGEEAVRQLSELDEPLEVARAHYALAGCIAWSGDFIPEPEKMDKNMSRALEHLRRAYEFSESVGDAHLLGFCSLWWGVSSGGEQSMKYLDKALQCAKETNDLFLKALTLDYQAYRVCWSGVAAEDPDQKRRLYERAIELYDKAQSLFSVISLMSLRGGVMGAPAGHAEAYLELAHLETDRGKRIELLEMSENAGVQALKVAEESGVPHAVVSTNHVLSKTLAEKALLTTETDVKRSLLEKALELRKKSIEDHERFSPYDYQPLGVYYSYLAGIMAELADLEPDLESRGKLLQEAVLTQEKGLSNLMKPMQYEEKIGVIDPFVVVVREQYRCGMLLDRLHKLTDHPDHLRRAIDTWQRAIEIARKLDNIVSIAELNWRIAQAQEALGEFSEAIVSFQQASESYAKAAESIPQLKDFYEDYRSYMQAWSEIEQAKQCHAGKQYGKAKEHYERAGELHTATKRWSHLGPNYQAWAGLEGGEDLSRVEQTEEARDLFRQSAELFLEAKKPIEAKIQSIEDGEEKDLATQLVRASDARREYCLGRVSIEEAKILDRQGDHAGSSRKYGAAVERFQRAMDALEKEREREEIGPVAHLCEAWEKMMMAEERASPTLYAEAAELFARAREHAIDSQTNLLALGNSSFCRALEAGARFEQTQDEAMYSAAKKHIEAATNYYVRAGFKTASEYAKATYMLFDAYMYAYRAQTETEPTKKAQFYHIAETLLSNSAGSYIVARHPEKSEEVKRILEGVKEKKQLALSLSEVLHAPAIASTTTSFSTPSATYERPVGLERFENADIQANLMPRDQEAKLGDTIRLKIDLINAGKGGAQLIKVAELLPGSFELVEKPDIYFVEDGSLNMKGRNLGPLRTEEVSLVMKPLDKGTFQIRPRILYLDEAGKYRSHEPDPATVTVKELGISGWLRGPAKDK